MDGRQEYPTPRFLKLLANGRAPKESDRVDNFGNLQVEDRPLEGLGMLAQDGELKFTIHGAR